MCVMTMKELGSTMTEPTSLLLLAIDTEILGNCTPKLARLLRSSCDIGDLGFCLPPTAYCTL